LTQPCATRFLFGLKNRKGTAHDSFDVSDTCCSIREDVN
jgi:hypothetical protein